MNCPKCGKGVLKKGESMVYCSEYKPKKQDNGEWVNEGSCEFRIPYRQKLLKRALTPAEIKKIVEGQTVKIGKASIRLDVDSPFFTVIEFEQKEDEDL